MGTHRECELDGRTHRGIFNATVSSASKAGIMSMTKALRAAFCTVHHILVNCVAPGTVTRG